MQCIKTRFPHSLNCETVLSLTTSHSHPRDEDEFEKARRLVFDSLWEVKYHFNFDMFLSLYLSIIIFNTVILVFGGIPSSSASLPLDLEDLRNRLPLVVLPATYRNQVLSGCVPLAVCAAYPLHRRVAMRAVSRSFPAKDLGKGAATRSWNGVKNLEAVGNVEISRPFHLSILSITRCLPIINPSQ